MKPKTFFLVVIAFLTLVSAVRAGESPRQRIRLDDNWKFLLGDPPDAASPTFHDGGWRTVTLPHDWSIESKIDPNAPSGRDGGYFNAGVGWYRQSIAASNAWQGHQVEIEFEGVYMNADVYLNGDKLASHPYGYTSFFVDLTSHLKWSQPNVLAVRVDNSQQRNSRWYSGSGIYRHVWLQVTNPLHFSDWGIFVRTDKADDQQASLSLITKVSNQTALVADIKIQSEVFGPKGETLGQSQSTLTVPAEGQQEVTQPVVVKNPPLWSPESPQISRVVTRLLERGTVLDTVTTEFGIRHIAWSATEGLTINGKSYKLKGGCIHGDNGVLGACAFDRAEERKIELLKAAGFNAIRTAHNPFSPALLNACDRLGMMVMENSFDCWTKGKNKFDYSLYFRTWWKPDLDSMLLRDRNHPSIVMWDLGNETPGIFSEPEVAAYAPQLVKEAHALDSTRPVTIASRSWPANDQEMAIAATSWEPQDIVGSNYRMANLIAWQKDHPDRVLLSSESHPPLGEWQKVLNNPFVVGDFEWTAQDYLGESGNGRWVYADDPNNKQIYPNHGSASGQLDILGNPKPVSAYWNVVWQTGVKLGLGVRQPFGDRPIKHDGWGWDPAWQSWTWPGWEQKPIEVEVYSTHPTTRLYLNNKLVAEKPTTNMVIYTLPYQPGVLKAVGVENNQEVDEIKLATVGDPASIQLKPDRTILTADGQDLSFVRVEVTDKDGNVQPNADELIHFTVTGPATIAGLGNANLADDTPYQGVDCHVFHGEALVVLRSSEHNGICHLKAESKGLSTGQTQVRVQR